MSVLAFQRNPYLQSFLHVSEKYACYTHTKLISVIRRGTKTNDPLVTRLSTIYHDLKENLSPGRRVRHSMSLCLKQATLQYDIL